MGELNGWKSRETLQADVEMSTEFYRVYDGSRVSGLSNLFKVAKWMHTIEPTVSYQYNPPVSQNKLPSFDNVDRIPFTSQITYGFTQRLIGKPEKEGVDSGPYEYARLKIFQSYSLGDAFAVSAGGNGKSFSNIGGELWLNLNPYLSGRMDAAFNPYRGDFDVLDGLVKVTDKRDDAVQVEYRSTREKIKEINFLTKIKTIEDLYLYGAIMYNLLDNWRVESVYGAEYKAQCWLLGVIVEDKNRSPDGTQKKELKVTVYFSLVGIGSVGHRPFFAKL
jgi:lipopolysaccharide assembly outer membrane protein LptD (OstA)